MDILNVPQDFPTIQAAIDVVAPGGTVIISSGNHELTSSLTIAKPLTLRGAGSEKTILKQANFPHTPVEILEPE